VRPGGSLIVGADASNIVRREAILRLVAQYKLPRFRPIGNLPRKAR
jgi:hypothetical protein